MSTLSSLQKNVIRRTAVGDILVRSTARTPDRRILRFRDRNFTYRELNEAVNRCAHGLAKLGVGKGDRAAILSHNCHHYVIYWWALMKLGAVITPLNFMLKGDEIRYIINHSEPTVFFVEDALIPQLGGMQDELKSVRTFGYIDLGGKEAPAGWMNIEDLWSEANPATEPEAEIDYDDPAILLYTSGTEAAPKGVLNSHLNFYMVLLSALADLKVTEKDVLIGGIPLYHVAAMYLCIASFAVGALYVMEYAPDPVEILKLTREEKITYWIWPPALYLYLPMVPDFDSYDLSSLRMCIVFGALAPPAVLDRWRKLLPDAEFMNYYGQTEMSPLGTCLQHHDMAKRPDSIGRSHLPLELKVFDPDGREVPRGETGELVARGPSVMLGYYREEEKTAYTFRGGWHHTGDMVRMDREGFVYFVDRAKDIIKTGGENVSSQEVEATLFKHAKVADAAVIGMPDDRWSEIVTAVIVPRPGQTLDEKEIIDFCKSEMAGYKVPKKIIFTDALPRNPSGKILKNILREKFTKA
ncbi:MAG TPA: long-chain-fatty-acid--CoA ligase [Syntrophales bacterium]|nr:long-chain-fatty-acid--CoA ligase [Syntrophales bacterium]